VNRHHRSHNFAMPMIPTGPANVRAIRTMLHLLTRLAAEELKGEGDRLPDAGTRRTESVGIVLGDLLHHEPGRIRQGIRP